MTDLAISDRHHRPLDGLETPTDGKAMRVRIIANAAARTIAGQHMIVCLTNLLCRMTGSVSSIELDFPEVESLVSMPHGCAQSRLNTAIGDMVQWAIGDAVTVTTTSSSEPADMILCLGADVRAPAGTLSLHALANGWYAWVGTTAHLPLDYQPAPDANPLGPFLAASLLAGEIFKRARGIKRGRWLENFGHCLWNAQDAAWGELPVGPPLADACLPPFYLVGAGAVGQGLINIIGSAAFRESYVITIDDDLHDRTNLNRCFIAGIDDVARRKVDAVARYRALNGIGGYDFAGTLNDYVRRPKPELRTNIAAAERRDRFDCVVSCVDKGTSRQDIQGLWPGLILGGSTLGLNAKTNVYDLRAGSACLACHNPPEKDGDELRKVERLVRAMDAEDRREYFSGADERDSILEYLAGGERCGVVGEAEFRAFAIRATREFSVSFVSMAAAVLLASRLFGRLIFKAGPKEVFRHMTSMAFLKGSIEYGDLSVDPRCLKCKGDPTFAAQNIATRF